MAANLKRMPPPPPIATNDPTFNRWLHDLTAFIAEGSGGIDTGLIPGYDALVAQVNQNTSAIETNTSGIAANTSAIAVNTSNIAANTSAIAVNTSNIAANTSAIAANTSAITALNARSQVYNGTAAPAAGLGVNGDWYATTVAPLHVYVKSGGAWVLIV